MNLKKRTFKLLTILLAFILVLNITVGWEHNDWMFRKQITLNHSMVEADLQDFPVLIEITDSDLVANSKANGDDILFTDGILTLSHEIEFYDNTLIAWVKIPILSSKNDTIIYMYYGNPTSPNQEDSEGVWSDYDLVHHLEETTGNIFDSTSNSYDGNAINVNLDSQGKIDGADGFD